MKAKIYIVFEGGQVHLESSFLVPFVPSVIEVNLYDLDNHHSNHSFNCIQYIQSRADQRDNSDTNERAIEGEVFEPVNE